jgi:MFS family permease
MVRRFCLYGFLKNQRYFEPFLVLFLLGKGLDFLSIGLLVGFRELVVNLLEVPSGALADLYGRRRAMFLSLTAYLVSFALFSWAAALPGLFLAMGVYGVGEVFRSGTHKAMIFDWLRRQGRAGEKARVYGLTRSFSQLGSAVSVWIAVLLVLADGGYDRLFWYSMVPYGLGMLNLLGYPAVLDATAGHGERSVRRHLGQALRQCLTVPPLRALLFESMLQRGTWQSTKDYLQPMVQHWFSPCLSWP